MPLTPRAAILHQLDAIRRFIKNGVPHLAMFELNRLEQSLISRFDKELGIETKEVPTCYVKPIPGMQYCERYNKRNFT